MKNYRLGRLIGQGAMAEVFEGTSLTGPGMPTVAIKVLSEEICGNAEFRSRYSREVSILTSLDHPNIVRLYQAGQEGTRLCMVMELIDGTSLRDLLEQGALDISRALSIRRASVSPSTNSETR